MAKDNYAALYEEMRTYPIEKLKNAKSGEVAKLFKKEKYEGDSDKLAVVLVLMSKIAHAGSLDEFNEFIATGETPPIKLNNDEMNMLRGGFSINWGSMFSNFGPKLVESFKMNILGMRPDGAKMNALYNRGPAGPPASMIQTGPAPQIQVASGGNDFKVDTSGIKLDPYSGMFPKSGGFTFKMPG